MSTAYVFDSTVPAEHFFTVMEEIFVLVRAEMWLRFREFTAPAKAASSGGGATSTSATTPSGGGSTSGSSSASSSGASSASTSGADGSHTHEMFRYIDDLPGATSDRHFQARDPGGTPLDATASTSPAASLFTYGAAANHAHGMAHTHGIAHTHGTPNHSHPAHDHDVPDHGHGLDYGIFREPMPGSIDVIVGVYHKPFSGGGSWTLEATISGLTDTEELVELTSIVDRAGLWRLTFQSAPGQPQGGRLTVDVTGQVLGAIQSA